MNEDRKELPTPPVDPVDEGIVAPVEPTDK